MKSLIITLSHWCLPVIIIFIISYGFIKGVKVYDSFTDGAREGFKTILNIFPNLLAMMVVISIFQKSGAMNLILKFSRPLLEKLNIPEPAFPLLFLRSLSGSGSLSYINQILADYGPDCFLGKLVSTIQGSTETTFYILAVYFGAIGIKNFRYSLLVGLGADLAGFMAAIFICNLLF